MTTGCVEYWFLLHYKKIYPSIQNVAEKEKILRMLMDECSGYAKGNTQATEKIAERMQEAVKNGRWVLEQIEGLPTLQDSDVRNRWLYQSGVTFTTVQDALEFLESLR